jgi:hypothetical protein
MYTNKESIRKFQESDSPEWKPEKWQEVWEKAKRKTKEGNARLTIGLSLDIMSPCPGKEK